MTNATTSKFADFVIEYGDGATPEVFTLLCGLRSKSFGIQNNMAKHARA